MFNDGTGLVIGLVGALAAGSLVTRKPFGSRKIGKGPYPFAEKQEQYRGYTPDQLRYALMDARKAMQATATFDAESEAWYSDDVHTILSELRRRNIPYWSGSSSRRSGSRSSIVIQQGMRVVVPEKYTVYGTYRDTGTVELVYANGIARVRLLAKASGGRVGYFGFQEVNVPVSELHPLGHG